jgi:hypothetical protein
MSPVTVAIDLDFFMDPHPRIDLINGMVANKPHLIEQFFEVGWHLDMRSHHIAHSSNFLKKLSEMIDPELAARVLTRFLEGLSPEEVNRRLMEKAHNGDDVPVLFWLGRGVHQENKISVLRALLSAARSAGADLEKTFNFSMKNSDGTPYRSDKHTLMGASLAIDARRGTSGVEESLVRASLLLEAGVPLDKGSMGVIVRDMAPERALIVWNHLKKKGATTAQELIDSTKRLQQNPGTLAFLQAELALEIMNQVQPSPKSAPH